VLLTRSPLSPGPKAWFSLDLHVLSAPPAFVLSQDQTLREGFVCQPRIENNTGRQSFHFEQLAQRPSRSHSRDKSWACDVDDEVETLSPGQAEAGSRSRFSTSKNVRC
jgi:hypothetical protein